MLNLRHTASMILLTLAMSACTPTITTHGNLLSPSKLQQVKAGMSTRADVQSYWGPPTTVAAFDPNIWYYIGETDSQEGIFAPEVNKRQMIRVTFDATDHVTDVSIIDNKLAKNVSFVSRTTPTAGKEFTAAQQFIGDIGKFNKVDKKNRSGP